MRRLLLVSPYFVPANTPDMQRVRLSLPYYREHGWDPIVLTVRPEHYHRVQEPELWETIPRDVEVHRVRALPRRFTSRLGVSNVALRALPYLYRKGSELLSSGSVDLVFFSTTQFAAPALGRLWQARHGVPYVVDLQDPWVSEDPSPEMLSRWPLKYRLARRMHAALEPLAMQRVGGLCAVSEAYLREVEDRHPALGPIPKAVIPFGTDTRDFDVVGKDGGVRGEGFGDPVEGVYLGRAGRDMERAARVFFHGVRRGLERNPDEFSRLRLRFRGTDYATGDRARKMIDPVAARVGVAQQVWEDPSRLPYLETLRRLRAADFLIILGSEDSRYSPSKLFTYLAAERPLLAILHGESDAARLAEAARPGCVVTFGGEDPADQEAVGEVYRWLARLLDDPVTEVTNDPTVMRRFSARRLTGEQCELFDEVVAQARQSG